MKATLRHWAERARSALWLIPSVMGAGAVLLSWALHQLDLRYRYDFPPPFSFEAGPEAARALLTTIAGAMIGVVGVVFSLSIVALTLASGQFGPRLLRAFLRDRTNQTVSGIFLATFLYALFALQVIPPDATTAELPHLTIQTAMLFVIASLASLLYYIHHLAHSIQADAVISEVATQLGDRIDTLYPQDVGDEPRTHPHATAPRGAAVAVAPHGGYVQAIEADALLAYARRQDAVVELLVRPGDFVVAGMALARAWPRERLPAPPQLEAHILLGRHPTSEQDLLFSVHQLVELALRALSPGINDPLTAMRCLDRLTEALAKLAPRRFPSPLRVEDGALRAILPRPEFPELVQAAYGPIRQAGRANVHICIHLMQSLAKVAAFTRDPARLEPLQQEAQALLADSRETSHPAADRARLDQAAALALAATSPAKTG